MDHEENIRQERIAFLIRRLLDTDDYLRIEDLADEMFVSRMTLDRLIPVVRQQMERCGVQLISTPRRGIKAFGGELERRNLMMLYGSVKPAKAPDWLADAVQAAITQNGLRIGETSLLELTSQISLVMNRIQRGKPLVNIPAQQPSHQLSRESAARDQLCALLEKQYKLVIPETDRTYLLILLMVKCVTDDMPDVQEDMQSLVDEILDDIYESMHIDLRQDTELKTALALHLHPLIYRMMFHLLQKNSVLSMVRLEMGTAFEMAQHASHVIYKRFGELISEDETAYIALHFAIGIERWYKQTNQHKIILLQNSTRGASNLMQWTIQNVCGYQEGDFIHCTSRELDTVNWQGVDCIVTPIPLPVSYPAPSVLFTPKAKDDAMQEIQRIRHLNERSQKRGAMYATDDLLFANMAFDSKEKALTFLCQKINEKCGIDLIAQVMKREMLAATELGNGLAVPHPYAYDGKSPILAAMTLKKELFWKYDRVRMVILIANPYGAQNYDYMGDLVGDLATDSKLMKRLIRSFDAKTMNELITVYRTKGIASGSDKKQ